MKTWSVVHSRDHTNPGWFRESRSFIREHVNSNLGTGNVTGRLHGGAPVSQREIVFPSKRNSLFLKRNRWLPGAAFLHASRVW